MLPFKIVYIINTIGVSISIVFIGDLMTELIIYLRLIRTILSRFQCHLRQVVLTRTETRP